MANAFGKQAETKCGKCDRTHLSALGPTWPPGPSQRGRPHPRGPGPPAVPETEVRETDRESPLKGQDPHETCYHSPQKTPGERSKAHVSRTVSHPEPGTVMSPATLPHRRSSGS